MIDNIFISNKLFKNRTTIIVNIKHSDFVNKE